MDLLAVLGDGVILGHIIWGTLGVLGGILFWHFVPSEKVAAVTKYLGPKR